MSTLKKNKRGGDVKMVETLDPTFPHRHTETTTIHEQIPFVRSPESS